MFNKTLFDRNAYDRSVASDGFNISLFSTGAMNLNIITATPLDLQPIRGGSGFDMRMVIQVPVPVEMLGVGSLNDTMIIPRQRLTGALTGNGILDVDVIIKMPIFGNVESNGDLLPFNVSIMQYVESSIVSRSDIKVGAIMQTPLNFTTGGSSALKSSISLKIPIGISLSGTSDISVRRFGSLGVESLELIGINLYPGESITIDTDLLDVMIGNRHDVTSVTTDSVFFELNPGESEITIGTDVLNSPLKATLIWQNRWL